MHSRFAIDWFRRSRIEGCRDHRLMSDDAFQRDKQSVLEHIGLLFLDPKPEAHRGAGQGFDPHDTAEPSFRHIPVYEGYFHQRHPSLPPHVAFVTLGGNTWGKIVAAPKSSLTNALLFLTGDTSFDIRNSVLVTRCLRSATLPSTA